MRTLDPRQPLFILLPALALFAACTKEDDPATEDPPGSNASMVAITDPSIVIMDVNGTTVTLEPVGGVGEIFLEEVYGGPSPDTSRAVLVAGFHSGGDTLFRLRIGTIQYTGGVPTTAELEAFLAPGTRVLAETDSANAGVSLEWWNAGGQWFGTTCDSTTTAGSFEITHVASQQIGLSFYVKIRAIFSGTFHSCDSLAGDQAITDGVLVLRFRDLS